MTTTHNKDEGAPRAERLYREASGRETRPEGIDERVIAAVEAQAQRVGRGARSGRQAPTGRRRTVTRRAFVLAGAGIAAVAGIGIIGAGLPLVGGIRQAGSPASADADLAGASASASRQLFGLAVASAAEVASGQRTTFELAPTPEGLVPVSSENPSSVSLVMNLAVTGKNVERITYATEGAPLIQYGPITDDGTRPQVPAIEFAKVVLGSYSPADPSDLGTSPTMLDPIGMLPNEEPPTEESVGDSALADFYASQQSQGYDMRWVSTRISVTQSELESGASNTATMLNVLMPDVGKTATTWENEVLQAYQDYQRALRGASEDIPTDAERPAALLQAADEAYAELMAAISKQCTDADTFLAWLRSCYVETMTKATDILAQATLVVTAEFEDGTTATRRYRIEPVASFEGAIGERFDALYEHSGVDVEDDLLRVQSLSSQRLMASLPLFDAVSGVPIDDHDDPRLQEALYTITDVTDEDAQG